MHRSFSIHYSSVTLYYAHTTLGDIDDIFSRGGLVVY